MRNTFLLSLPSLLLLIVFTLPATPALAQVFPPKIYFTDTLAAVSVYQDWSARSESQSQSFMHGFLFGKYLDNDIKEPVAKKLSERNHFIAESLTGVAYTTAMDSIFGKKGRWTVQAQHYVNYSTGFDGDLWRLAFLGNAPFAGDTLSIGEGFFEGYQWLTVKGGIELWLNDHFAIRPALGIVAGIDRLDVHWSDSWLYTAPMGFEVAARAKADAFIADNSWSHWGGLVDLGFVYRKGWTITAGIMDLGVVNWGSGTEHLVDTALAFDGVEVNQVIDFGSAFQNASFDSLFDFALTEKKAYQTTLLPFTAYIQVQKQFNERLNLGAGLLYKYLPEYLPYFYVAAVHDISVVDLGVSLGYGGYGGASVGVNVARQFDNGLFISVGSRDIVPFIVPKQFPGSSLQLMLGWRI